MCNFCFDRCGVMLVLSLMLVYDICFIFTLLFLALIFGIRFFGICSILLRPTLRPVTISSTSRFKLVREFGYLLVGGIGIRGRSSVGNAIRIGLIRSMPCLEQ